MGNAVHEALMDELDHALPFDQMMEMSLGKLRDLTQICERARADVLELRQLKAHHSAEVARLEQLVAFGEDPTYCHNCDLRMLNLQVLLRALSRVSVVVFADFA